MLFVTRIVVKALITANLERRSVLNLPFLISVTTSKELTFIFDFSKVNLILGWKLFSSFKHFSKFFSLPAQIKNTSSKNRLHTHNCRDCVLRNYLSMKSIKIQSYGGGNKFSTNSGLAYLLEKLEIKLKNTFLKTFFAIFMISSASIFLYRNLTILFAKNL